MVKAPAPKTNGSAPNPDTVITLTYGELQRLVEAHVTHAVANLRAEAVTLKIQSQVEAKESK